jgi:tripartite-type tricarboxylate transporter receptor subunit TctC
MAFKNLVRLFVVVNLCLMVVFKGYGSAEEAYPDRPVTMIVSWGPGMFDTMIRVLCKAAEKKLGQPIIVENKPGASGIIGTNYVIKSTPDGYTIGETDTAGYISKPYIMNVPYDPFRDLTDICGVFKYIHGYAVKTESPWKTHEEVIAYSKKNPGKFKYGVSGLGTMTHLPMAWISMKEGAHWTAVPFKSGGEAAMACLGGHTDAFSAGSMDIMPLVKAGKMRLMLGLNDFRWPEFPDVPNMAEKGYGFSALTIIGIAGPRGIPEPIVKKLEHVFKEAVEDSSFVEVIKKSYLIRSFMSGKEFTEHNKSRENQTRDLIKTLGLLKK